MVAAVPSRALGLLPVQPKPPGEAKAATPAPATTAAPTPQATPAATTPAAEAPAAADSMDASADNSAPSAGSAEDIAELESMGFPSDQVAAALRAAFGNKARAVEYLMDPSVRSFCGARCALCACARLPLPLPPSLPSSLPLSFNQPFMPFMPSSARANIRCSRPGRT